MVRKIKTLIKNEVGNYELLLYRITNCYDVLISILCRAHNLLMIKWTKNKWQKFKEWSSVDHWIDMFVDVGLIAFDVLSSPILIVVRFIRFFFNRYINEHIKRFLKWFAHRVLRL